MSNDHGDSECADGHVMTTDLWGDGTPVPGRRCHFCKTEGPADDERRERYAEAVPQIRMGDQHYAYQRRVADAVMVVAAAEITAERERGDNAAARLFLSMEEENDRLRAELAAERKWRTEMQSSVRAQRHRADNYRENWQAAEAEVREQDAENARLRAELAATQRNYDHVGTAYNAMAETNARLRATIERINAAARKVKNSGNVWDMEDLIDAALNGDQA